MSKKKKFKRSTRKPMAKPARQKEPDTPTGPPPRSPLLSVTKAGSGAFRPLMAEIPARAIAAILESEGGHPPGTLLTLDVPASEEKGIENALSNAVVAFSVYRQFEVTSGGKTADIADHFLRQFMGIVAVARELLDHISSDPHGREDRVQARARLDYLHSWAAGCMLQRSGAPLAPMEIPETPIQLALELARIGNRLRHSWHEMKLAAAPQRLMASAKDKLVEQARGETEEAIRTRERVELDQRMSSEARLTIDCCARYAMPGHDIVHLPGNGMDPLPLLRERAGQNPNWRDVNSDFCRGWINYWLTSLPSVRYAIGVQTVSDLSLAAPAAKLCQGLYVRLLSAAEPATEIGTLVSELAELRLRLGPARFQLADFFNTLHGTIEVKPSWKEYFRSRERTAEPEAAPPAAPPDSKTQTQPRLTPTERKLLKWMSRQTERLQTRAIADGMKANPKSIGKHLRSLKDYGYLDNPGREGFLITAPGKARASSLS